ncbi:MAG: nuclear transport factor 2 family protein [Chthoniobacterales bacterium]|nr:nuclear transport factor 2 family protein [Chthoniobacterales bacterium]
MDPTDLAQLTYDRTEIADTFYRYALGLDHGDANSLASAFTADCVFDFTPAGAKLGIDFPVVSGRGKGSYGGKVGPMTSSDIDRRLADRSGSRSCLGDGFRCSLLSLRRMQML